MVDRSLASNPGPEGPGSEPEQSRRPSRLRGGLRLAAEAGVVVGVLAAALALSSVLVRALSGRADPARTAGEPSGLARAIEQRLREAAVSALEPQLIRDEGVEQSLAAIRERILEGLEKADPGLGVNDWKESLRIVLLDSASVNAFAFPGGLVVLCAGLVRALESAEELAAVLAHEAAHVARRDPSRAMARELGLSAVLAVFGGREAEVLVQRLLHELIRQHYSREVEAAADQLALAALEQAEIDPAALADALQRLQRSGEEAPRNLLRYLASHPDLGERIERAREAAAKAHGPWRPFDPVVWQRLRAAV